MQAISRVRLTVSRGVRSFASQPSLDIEFPGNPAQKPASMQAKPKPLVTTLDNGLRVASQETYGQVTAFGMFVDAGSKYETDSNNGVSHMLEHMAFKSTKNRSHLKLVRDVEEMGGQMGAACAREVMIYQGECLRDHVNDAIEILADTIVNPAFAEWDLDEQRKVIGYELEDMEANPQTVVTELVHKAAFTDSSPLGRSLWCPKRNIGKLTVDDLRAHMDEHYTADKMVLSAAGIEHDTLVELAKKHFSGIPKGTGDKKSPISIYVGGDERLRGDSPLTHVSMCFNAGGWNSKNLLELCTLHMLLGGGGSFSAGGPGKGMYSRLYTNVLNRHHWIESCTAFNSMYSDAGLIGIYGTCDPQAAGMMVNVMSEQLISVAQSPASSEELMRAKNQLKSSIHMKLESRQTIFEDMGRQLLTYGHYEGPTELCARIDGVTAEGVMKAAKEALSSPLSMASFGDVSSIDSYQIVDKKFDSFEK